jgi:F-type H+-transporting ATPase subunit gamma
MQTIEALKKNIQSADDLHTIVRTMKTLSAVSIRQHEKAVESITDYLHTVELGLQVVLQQGKSEIFSKKPREQKGTCALVFGSDQGLCGGFNEQIVAHALKEMYEYESTRKQSMMVCIGSRVSAILEEKGHPIEKILRTPGSLSSIVPLSQETVVLLNEWQTKGRIDQVVLFHHMLISSASYKPFSVHLLPLNHEWLLSLVQKKWPTHVLPTFTMNQNALFTALVKQYIFISLFRACVQSMASENAARLSSMQAAEKNIIERLETLNAIYRNQRQNTITSELLDIIAGFESLKSEAVGEID